MAQVDEDIGDTLRQPLAPGANGCTAQVIGTGPTVRHSAMPEVFETLIFAARRELFITTPYYVPDESMAGAVRLRATRRRRDDDLPGAQRLVDRRRASHRSYYAELLAAGVRLFEYGRGLLHTKSRP